MDLDNYSDGRVYRAAAIYTKPKPPSGNVAQAGFFRGETPAYTDCRVRLTGSWLFVEKTSEDSEKTVDVLSALQVHRISGLVEVERGDEVHVY